jgi:HlyD family secretion protein
MKGKRSYRRHLRYMIPVLVLIAIVAAVGARQSHKEQPDVQTAIVKRGTVLSSVSGNGILQPLTTVEVKSNVGGQVVQLAVDEGDTVKAGQLIARMDPSDSLTNMQQSAADLESAHAKLRQSSDQANIQPLLTATAIRQAQSSLASAEATLRQTKTALIPQKLSSAQTGYDQAKANYDQSAKNLERQNALLAKGFVAKSQVESADQQYTVTKAQMDAAKSKLDTVKDETDQDLQAAEARVEEAKASLDSAKANAYQVRVRRDDIVQSRAQVERARAAVKNAQTQIGYATVVAPRAGVVVKKYVEAGSIVTAGRQAMAGSGSGVTIVEIADVSRMRVVVDVDESDIAKISIGQQVDVSVEACPDELFPARVIKIAPEAQVTQSVTTVPVTVELQHADSRLKPEMNATCDFVIDRKENVLFVPIEAISETDAGTEVTVLDHGQQAVRKVEVGLTGDDYCEVVSGLRDGETVVIPDEEPAKKSSGSGGPGGPGGPPPPM